MVTVEITAEVESSEHTVVMSEKISLTLKLKCRDPAGQNEGPEVQ